MPNTEVKLIIAENTCELPCWEDKLSPVFLCKFEDVKASFFVDYNYKKSIDILIYM